MAKKVLALYYTQSGQLEEIVDRFVAPFIESGAIVEKVNIKPENDFPFPWSGDAFFNTMPESVLGIPLPLEPFNFKELQYDLVVFAYQPWFLSPSIPATSIIKHPQVQKIIANTPVITLIGSRNMWLNAQEKVKKVLKEAGANLVGNIALFDRNPNLVSAVTIMHWAFNGKKDSYLGIFPKPGISDEDIQHTREFGNIATKFLQAENWDGLQAEMVAKGAVDVKSNLMFIEERAGKLFSIWANLVYGKKSRAFRLLIFKYYLLFALFIVAPIVLTLNFLLFRVFFLRSNAKKKLYYAGVSLK